MSAFASVASGTFVRRRTDVLLLLGGLLAIGLPIYSLLADAPYALIFATRVMIYGIDALSLNIILGYAGLVSFGHAAFLTICAYSVAILATCGITAGAFQLLTTIVASAIFGALTGMVALRATGIAFIMITLAFAQMVFFLFVSLKQFGGDEGLSIAASSQFGGIALGNPRSLYCLTLFLTIAILLCKTRFVESTFGTVLRGSKANDERMRAFGFPTFRYKLIAYMVAASICGIAGFLLANLTLFASPSYGSWIVSGELMLMVALGGVGTVAGPFVGAAALLILEDILKRSSIHWMGILGVIIVVAGMGAKRGLWGLLTGAKR